MRAAGAGRQRRTQAAHPSGKKPELLATGPNPVWLWEINHLPGAVTGLHYRLYAIPDFYRRAVLGWLVILTEAEWLAATVIATLPWHADHGAAMASQPVAAPSPRWA